MHLRQLELRDAPFMLEWMKDPQIACFFRFDAASMTEDSCRRFIETTWTDASSRHFAIADENDEYLGTISLKDITEVEAEYAISTRKKAHGTGVARDATNTIFRIGFNELGLKRIFLNVLADNSRANAFYRKIGFDFLYTEIDAIELHGERRNLNWYEITADKYWRSING